MGAPATGVINAATSSATGAVTAGSSTAPATNTAAGSSADTTTQANTADAMSAAAAGAGAAGNPGTAGGADSSATPDVLAPPSPNAAVKGARGRNGPPGPAHAVSDSRATAEGSAKGAAVAPAAMTLGTASAADRHASGRGDSLLSGMPGDGVAAAAQLNAGTAAVPDAAPAPTLKVAAGMDTAEFGQGLADRVTWMVDNNLNGAKLQVNPPQLGPVEVRIAVQGNHAQVWLTSHSAVTRDALESSSPKLREMLGAQGFGQVSVDISQRSFQERSTHPQPYEWTPSASGSTAIAAAPSTAGSLPRASSGAVDAYA
jgi:flagellar hook-length control protein FliK